MSKRTAQLHITEWTAKAFGRLLPHSAKRNFSLIFLPGNQANSVVPPRSESIIYHHIKSLMHTIRIDTPDPALEIMLLEQFGGAKGELAAAMQ